MTQERNKEPKYYETWAELIVDMRFHRVVAATSLFAFFIILFWGLKVLQRPPMVIRVDSLGNPAIVEARSEGIITPQEVQNFVTYFVEYWRGWDFYKYDDYFNRVSSMMSREMINTADSYLRDDKVIEKIKSQKHRHKIILTDIVIKSRDKNFVVVEVSGNREEGSYDSAAKKQVRFMATLTLIVVPRINSPWGLLATNYDERVFD